MGFKSSFLAGKEGEVFWERTKLMRQEGGEEGGSSSRGGQGPYHSAAFLQARVALGPGSPGIIGIYRRAWAGE